MEDQKVTQMDFDKVIEQDTVPTDNLAWKPAYKTPYNYREYPQDHEENWLASMTQPDQTMTVKQILERHARGLPISDGKVPLYEDEEAGEIVPPEWAKMDISERDEWMREKVEELQEIKRKHRKEQEERDRIKTQQYWRKKIMDEKPWLKDDTKEGSVPAPSAGGGSEKHVSL